VDSAGDGVAARCAHAPVCDWYAICKTAVPLEEVVMSRLGRSLFVGVLAAFAGCSDGPSSPSRTTVIQPIEIESVVPSVHAARPANVTIEVKGALGGGCDTLHAIEQRRAGSNVQVDITRTRVTGPDVICTMELKLYQERLGLSGTFAPGVYTVRVNTVTAEFRVE
jgi:hypothetical protein